MINWVSAYKKRNVIMAWIVSQLVNVALFLFKSNMLLFQSDSSIFKVGFILSSKICISMFKMRIKQFIL